MYVGSKYIYTVLYYLLIVVPCHVFLPEKKKK